MPTVGILSSAAASVGQSDAQVIAGIQAQLTSLAMAQRVGTQSSDTITAGQWQSALTAFLNPAGGNGPSDYEAAIARAIVNGGPMPTRPSAAEQLGLSDDDYDLLTGPPSNLADSDIQQLISSGQLTDYLAHIRQVNTQNQWAADQAAFDAYVPTDANGWWWKYGGGNGGVPRFGQATGGTIVDGFVLEYDPNNPSTPGKSPAMDAEWQKAKAANDARFAAVVNNVQPYTTPAVDPNSINAQESAGGLVKAQQGVIDPASVVAVDMAPLASGLPDVGTPVTTTAAPVGTAIGTVDSGGVSSPAPAPADNSTVVKVVLAIVVLAVAWFVLRRS